MLVAALLPTHLEATVTVVAHAKDDVRKHAKSEHEKCKGVGNRLLETSSHVAVDLRNIRSISLQRFLLIAGLHHPFVLAPLAEETWA